MISMSPVRWVNLWAGLLALFISVNARPYVHFQTPTPAEADSEWADKNLQSALNYVLPMGRPDPSFEDQDYISYRYINWIHVDSLEYSFSLMLRSSEAPGPLRYYWVGRIHMAEGASIRMQLAQLHAQHPDEKLAEVERQIKVKTWALDEKTCPAVRIQATKFLDVSFTAPWSSDVVTDAPLFEFQVESLNGSMKLSFGDGNHPLVSWAAETRSALAQCGAADSAGLKGKDY